MALPQIPSPAPQQERSRRSQERVLAAARDLLARGGQEAVVMAEVAQLAGVAVGTVYTRFRDKTDLLRAVHAREAEEMQRHTLAALESIAETAASPSARLEGAVRALVDVFRQHATVMRELFLLAGGDEVIRAQGSAITDPVARAFADLVTAPADAGGSEPALVADVCYRTVFAACAYRVTYGADSESPRDLPWDVLEAELTRMCLAYAAAF